MTEILAGDKHGARPKNGAPLGRKGMAMATILSTARDDPLVVTSATKAVLSLRWQLSRGARSMRRNFLVHLSSHSIFGVIFAGLIALAAALKADPAYASIPGVNSSPDPYELYGGCTETAEFGGKQFHVYAVGRTLDRVLAITVLECTDFTGGGPTRIIPCPAGSPYAYCLFNDNDGAGNLFRMGILREDHVTRPNAPYSGCPAGARLRPKTSVVAAAGRELRLVKGIVTLSCRQADGGSGARIVACPQGPSPYTYCVQTHNDGSGNAVLLGVVTTSGAGDPYGLYGQCHPGAQPGYQAKVNILRDTGISRVNVRSIDLIGCFGPGTSPDIPATPPARVQCSSVDGFNNGQHYDICIWGLDSKGNYLKAGIVTAPAARP